MAAIISAVVTGVTWCFCTATASLLSSCCGNDKPSSIPPSATSGRKRSVFLLFVAVGIAFAFQYGLAPYIINDVPIDNFITDQWTDGCMQYATEALRERCAGNNGAYRAIGSATFFFVLAGLASLCKPSANREAWPAKYVLFIFLVGATIVIPNEPVFSDIYLQIARIGAVIFILMEQVIIIDLAYNWNDSWVEKSNQAESDEPGTGKKWLGAILASCAILYVGSIVAIALLYHFFSGCQSNNAFITVTLIMGVVVTGVQLSGEESSLLTSANIVAYATFLCYTAVAKNPNADCNPNLGELDGLGIALGVGITLLSLAWTAYSKTAHDRMQGGNTDDNGVSQESLVENGGREKSSEDRKITGVIAGNEYGTTKASSGDEEAANNNDEDEDDANVPSNYFGNSWKLNAVLGLVSCWVAMALTGWGSIESGGDAANPDVGKVSMWMIITSQWIILVLYLWTLVAPRLFPDRDFS